MAHQIDISRGTRDGTVNAQWASRPADQRFPNLYALRDQVKTWADKSRAIDVAPSSILIDATEDAITFDAPEIGGFIPSPYGFDSLASLAGVPRQYARTLAERGSHELAAACLADGLANRDGGVSLYAMEDGDHTTLRGVTSPKYGRIFDHDVAEQLIRVAGDGLTGRWRIPGKINWSTMEYDPANLGDPTLYASDRDLFVFLTDPDHPIEVGKLANGAPDLLMRGIAAWNSEVGSKTFGVTTWLFRACCENRNLWGVENTSTITIRHSSGAPERFLEEMAPTLEAFATSATTRTIEAVKAARAITFEHTDENEEQMTFLTEKLGFTQKVAKSILATDPDGQGASSEPSLNAWDLSQRVTAWTRDIEFSDERMTVERRVGAFMDKITA